MSTLRRLIFWGAAYEEMTALPSGVQYRAGFQLKQVQAGGEPEDWKPMKSIGPGVSEIRIRDQTGAYRVIYVAKFEEAVYVLHCFEKRSQKTGRHNLEIATARYRELIRRRDH